jgi:2-polyprenyl-3-methyl-5-hydroxy-6-metoxy-1,4-benzoquinol methylase
MSDNGKIIRKCIICGKDDYETIFTFTYEYLTKIYKNIRSGYVDEIEWTPDTTSSIVRCRKCGSIYTRDVFVGYERAKSNKSLEEVTSKSSSGYTMGKAEGVWILNCILFLAQNSLFKQVRNEQKGIKFLDFGSGTGALSNLVRAMGIRDVYALDPYTKAQKTYYEKYNYPGIVFSRDKDDIFKHAPFDVVVSNSVFEHLFDPVNELISIYDNMSKGGLFYVTNPFMDIDREINQLLNAKSIYKKDSISHYHPGHINYLKPKQFKAFLKRIGFEVLSFNVKPPVPLTKSTLKTFLRRNAVQVVKTAFNSLGVPYSRHAFVVRKK